VVIILLHQPECNPQVQEPLCPGFQREMYDALLVEVIDDLLKDHAGELLAA
jgi:hypothetical protein